MTGKKLAGDRTLYVDCDDTLVAWDLSKYPDEPRVTVTCYGHDSELVPNRNNINTLIKFAKLGHRIIVWSQSGADWAEAVAKELCIDDYCDLYITKPSWYLDDLPTEAWLPASRRIWREPV